MSAFVVYANAIETDIALVAAPAIYRTASGIAGTRVCSIARIGNSGLQRKQVGHVATLQRQFLYLILAKRYTHGRVFGVDYRCLPGNFDLGGGARRPARTTFTLVRHVDQKLEIGLLVFLETSLFHRQDIGTRGKREKFEFAGGRSSSAPADPLRLVGKRYRWRLPPPREYCRELCRATMWCRSAPKRRKWTARSRPGTRRSRFWMEDRIVASLRVCTIALRRNSMGESLGPKGRTLTSSLPQRPTNSLASFLC